MEGGQESRERDGRWNPHLSRLAWKCLDGSFGEQGQGRKDFVDGEMVAVFDLSSRDWK